MVPPLPLPPSDIPVKIPFMGMIKQLRKNTPCIIIRYFSHLSAFLSALTERPMKKAERAMIPYPGRS